ncbi:glycosyltransferase [Campylobacter gracilis]|uniref:Glycosyltransferase, group 1 family protein n=1 Tax=Campylobacter gracilis RM3268 TaxID=553220 RepID=C8PJU9_9BACT|nr:glycosyltransferase [Campylobacter gracilis]AKT92198.1 glycosyltransferase, family 1 [Campylobacter gracilis]EEV17204.1 glycosyltransferase, group 1 family protein [Campylobacter gracilis RM3268]UEB45612.1 glycosyltransferase [Campylobacter gracilis]SUW81714.1 TatD family deoxyribonuclease [Campylobacter gracilis]
MKILFITLRADHGGGPKHIDLLINNLSSEIEIYLACPQDRPYYDLWNESKKIKDIFILPHRKFSVKKLLGLNKFIKDNDIEIVHSHGKGAGIYSRILKILNQRLKIVHTLHGVHIGEYGFFKKSAYIFLERFLTLFTDKFINVSMNENSLCLKLKLFKKSKSEVVHNGVKALLKDDDAKIKFNLSGKRMVTTISRFDYAKNMSLAYEIAQNFKDNSDIVFLWLGDGDDRAKFESMAQKDGVNIIFTGFTDEVPAYLSATDIYLSTSRWEGLPYALIEAQSLGIPVVATNVVGNNEVVENGKSGFLFENAQQACRDIEILLNDEKIYGKMQSEALLNFKDKFDIGIAIRKVEKIYEQIFENRSTRELQ